MTDFSAQEPALGYYYQIRLSLLLLLRAKDKTNPTIKIETLDDIVVDDINSSNLYQTKLHVKSVVDLTNASPDFWKTIRVWSENISGKLLDVENTVFTLITTARISENSFIKKFQEPVKRDNKDILKDMLDVTTSSSNLTNKSAYDAFKKLNEGQQLALIDNICILDSGLSIDEALNGVKNELRFSCSPGKVDSLVERLEGWWFQECIKILQGINSDGISLKELSQKIYDISDSFKEDNLPDDFADPLTIEESELSTYEERIFIQQLKLVAVRSNLLRNAISDFRRAFEQRSKWLREELASLDEVEQYEKRLYDHWNNIFLALKDDVDGFSEEQLKQAGLSFYKKFYIDTCPPIRIRSKFQSEYLTRGSCHMLADIKKIGWHPDFQNRIS